jgi:hypothetical protein
MTAPATRPTAIPAMTATLGEKPSATNPRIANADAMLEKARMPPTDRSMPPEMIANVWPSAIVSTPVA